MARSFGLSDENRRTIERLRNLPSELTGKNGGPIRSALFQAAKLIRDDAIARAPEGTDTPLPGRLKRNVRMLRERNPRSQPDAPAEKYYIYVRGGNKQGASSRRRFRGQLVREGFSGSAAFRAAKFYTEDDAYYWRFVEFGTAKMPATPFLRPAFEANKAEAVRRFEVSLKDAVDKIERRITVSGGGSALPAIEAA